MNMIQTSEKLSKETLLAFIQKFHDEYKIVPGTGFLAGYFKVTIQTVNRKLEQLHEEKKIKRMVSQNSEKKNYSTYKII